MIRWVDTPHCQSRAHCSSCRDSGLAGTIFRDNLARRYDLSGACPGVSLRSVAGGLLASSDEALRAASEGYARQVESLLQRPGTTSCQRSRWVRKARLYRQRAG